MGETYAEVTLGDNGKRVKKTLLVDTGATYSWIDAATLTALGVKPRREIKLETIEGHMIKRKVGAVEMEYDGLTAPTMVVFATGKDSEVLGLHALEGLALEVDPTHRTLKKLRAVKALGSLRAYVFTILVWFSVGSTYAETLEEAFKTAPAKLNAATDQTLKIAVGEFKFEGVVPSAFGEYLASEISALLSKMPNYEEIDRKNLHKILEEQKLSMSGLVQEGSTIKPGEIKGVEAFVSGNFFDAKDHVKVAFTFVHTETGKTYTVTGTIKKDNIPSGIELRPANYKAVAKALELWGEAEGKSKELKVKVWVDSPDGLYKEGETIVIHFVVNRNCYIKLIHTDSSGKMQELYPNSFEKENYVKANEVYSIPTDEMGFTFDVSPPYGSEILKIFASTNQFQGETVSKPKEGEVFKDLGKADGESIQKQKRATRGITIKGIKPQVTDATCVFTTMEKEK